MKKCDACGYTNEDSNTFCSECGTSLPTQSSRKASREETNIKKDQPPRKRTPIILALAAIAAIGLFTSYQMIAKKYSEEAVVDQFHTALTTKNKTALKELIVPSDSRLKVNDQSLDALFALIDKEPSLVQEIEDSLRNEGLSNHLFYLREDGKHYGIFDRHVVDTPGYFIKLDSTGGETTVYLNDHEISVLDEAGEVQEFGPFLVGAYTVKGMRKAEDGTKEDEITLELSGTKTEKIATLQTGDPEKQKEEEKKEEVKEKTVVKEVIREVAPKTASVPAATYSYYIIPHSDYAYLTYDDLAGFSQNELRLARNEIFARHGYVFKSKDLRNYFNSQAWYSPNPSFRESSLSAVEKSNVDFIKSFE
ncbi:YARHG domain-containing protein [Bacillus sp. B190/17]|uniref:YARHG domain-containing protein n=1 Tax=Bacillus lumedeiriae TaxID=3058829 RepID=A0ABW8IAV3_9BACI